MKLRKIFSLVVLYSVLYVVYHGLKNSFLRLRYDCEARGSAGGSAIMGLIIVFIAGVIGLALTPQFVTFSIQASWAYNNTSWEALAGVFYVFVIPILYAVIMIMMLVGASVGAYRVGKKLI